MEKQATKVVEVPCLRGLDGLDAVVQSTSLLGVLAGASPSPSLPKGV